MEPTTIGVDIGGTNLRAARVSRAGEILAVLREVSSPDPDVVLSRVSDLIAGVRDDTVTAIGIGVPGRVDHGAQKVLSGGYVDLSALDIVDTITARTGLPVTIDNDGNMALLAEAWIGAARGRSNVTMLTIGTGIGGAVLDGGEILRGRGSAGQLGHLTVDPEGPLCVCGRRGCVETYGSGTSLGRHIAEAGLPRGTTAAELLARRADDPVAERVLRAWAGPLRVAIDSLATTLDPELVLLGGGLGHEAVAAVESLPGQGRWIGCDIAAAALGNDAGVIGSAYAALTLPAARPRRAVLVNGLPASGKSGVAAALSQATGWPVLGLDTIKNPFLDRLQPVDRPFNRELGKASYQAIFDLIGASPAGTVAIVDAWFGFQPPEVLDAHLARNGIEATIEIWCHAPPETLGARYAARVETRKPGHPGLDYVPELIALARTAGPLRRGPMIEVDTTRAIDAADLRARLAGIWPGL